MVRQNGQNGSTYTDLKNSVNATNSLVLETEDTNPVLYMSTITSSGINKEMYQLYESGTTYRFIGAYIATTSSNEYSLVDSNKVTKLMGRKEKDSDSEVMKYQYKGDTTYRNLESDQTVIFVYSNAELTQKANLYSENGITLYASGESTVNLTNINGILDTTSKNDIIPESAKNDRNFTGLLPTSIQFSPSSLYCIGELLELDSRLRALTSTDSSPIPTTVRSYV